MTSPTGHLKSVSVVYSFARSGGTLLNQILGVHPDVLILSEVNPSRSYVSTSEQALQWLKLIGKDEKDRLDELSYGYQIEILQRKAQNRGKRLVIRDWSIVNFMDTEWPPTCQASRILEQELYLEHHGFSVSPLVVTRKFASMAASIYANFPALAKMPIEKLAKAYLEYAKAVQDYPRISLENLQAHPLEETYKALGLLGLKKTEAKSLINNFYKFKNCTGNITLSVRTNSSSWKTIHRQTHNEKIMGQPKAGVEADIIFGYV